MRGRQDWRYKSCRQYRSVIFMMLIGPAGAFRLHPWRGGLYP